MIAPNFVSPPSRARWPPSSRTLRHPSQTRSRSGGNCGELDASKRRGGCVLDLDPDQLARRRRAGEVHSRVAARAASHKPGLRAALPFDKPFLGAADAFAIAAPGGALNADDQSLYSVTLDLV